MVTIHFGTIKPWLLHLITTTCFPKGCFRPNVFYCQLFLFFFFWFHLPWTVWSILCFVQHMKSGSWQCCSVFVDEHLLWGHHFGFIYLDHVQVCMPSFSFKFSVDNTNKYNLAYYTLSLSTRSCQIILRLKLWWHMMTLLEKYIFQLLS